MTIPVSSWTASDIMAWWTLTQHVIPADERARMLPDIYRRAAELKISLAQLLRGQA